MKKLVLLSLLLVLAASAAFAQEAPAATAIKSVLQRDVKPQGRNADGSFDANPAVPGMSPTTGLPVGTQPYVPILMQIDNNFGALPHWGVLHADIMYELPVAGGGLTRLTALFSDRHPSQAGPVRSARLMHADLREEWDALFIHFGEQTTEGSNFQQAVRDYGANKKGLVIDGIGNKYASYFTRTRYHGAPHNVSVDLKGFFDLMVQGGYQFPLRPFLFEDGVTPAGPDAVKVSVIHKENEATAATYLYDVNRREYLRFTGKGIYQDLLSPQETLAYANVIVQRTKLAFNRRSSNPLLPEVVGSGAADIFIGGKYVAGAWSRATAQSRTVFLDAQGKEIVLQPGRTWIVITNEDTAITYEGEYDADTAAYYAQKGSLPIYRPLKLGDRGDEVRALKQRLFELGFLRSGNFNNRYHEEIVEAVRQFQQQNGLEATGIAGSLTLAKLYEGAAPSQVTPEPSASDSPFTVDPSADETPAPTPGATPQPTQEQDVTLNPGGPTGSPDATATPGTTETPAPVDAQPVSATVRTGNSAALNVRERADSGSRLIVRIYNGTVVEVLERGDEWTRIRFQNQEGYVMTRYLRFITPSETPFLSQYRTLTLGDAGPEVLRLKQRFYELGYFRTKDFNDKYQQSTADTVRRFEQRNGLPADGIADPAMQELLFSSDARKP